MAFTTDSRGAVDAFHAAALQAGATDNGGPGVREIYHPSYYGMPGGGLLLFQMSRAMAHVPSACR